MISSNPCNRIEYHMVPGSTCTNIYIYIYLQYIKKENKFNVSFFLGSILCNLNTNSN